MDAFTELSNTLALSMGAAWASGINLYAAVLMLGVMGTMGYMELPEALQVLQDPLVIGAAGLMYAVIQWRKLLRSVLRRWAKPIRTQRCKASHAHGGVRPCGNKRSTTE